MIGADTKMGEASPVPATPKPIPEILRTLQILTPPAGVFEVRGVKPRAVSGYFDTEHLEEAVRAIESLDASGISEGLYLTINEVNPALLSRRANRIETKLPPGAPTTADADIIRRRWLLVDIDPERPSGISSTDEEHVRALEMAGRVAGFLTEFCGFPAPVRADSGNGAHLLYRIDLPNDEESKALITRCLQALGAAFSGRGCDIDQTVFNAARIGRLYGTVARKGDHTPERPHRRSKILEVPEVIEVVPREALANLAALAPEEEQPRHDARPRSGGDGIDLDEWLREYGASLPLYHAKSKPGFRSFYLFDVCPWDPSHRDRSAFVGQLSHGPLVAGCHHNGCSGNGWVELRALVEPKRPKPIPARKEAAREGPATPPAKVSDRPEICTTGAATHEMATEALAVLQGSNQPPAIFARGAQLVRAALDEKRGLYIQVIGEAELSGILDRMISWTRVTSKGVTCQDRPPREVVRDILALPAIEWGVPPLAGVTRTPVFHIDGTIHATPGYDERTGLYYSPDEGFTLPSVPEVPTQADVAAALSLIEEIFVDFPFVGEADRANAYGALLTAVLRPCITGSVPLYLCDKPQAGSGAGLLQRVIGVIALGHEPPLRTLPGGEEMRKELFSTLKNGTRLQIFDNVEDRLSSPELAAVLTAPVYTGRILGKSEEVTIEVFCFWMANGNNVVIGGDLARRTFKTRIDPQVATPWQREGFKHPDILAWVDENRGKILAAVFTLARAWIRAGKPLPERVPRVGSFETWRDTVGGILEHAGVAGFMANADEVYLEGDADRLQWETFLQALWDFFGCNPFTAGSVASLLMSEDPSRVPLLEAMPDDLAESFLIKKGSFSRVLGKAFAKINGRHFPGGYCLKQGKRAGSGHTWIITYSPPAESQNSGVYVGCISNLNDTQVNERTAGDSPVVTSGNVCVYVPLTPPREKKIVHDTCIGGAPDHIHHLHAPSVDKGFPETKGHSGNENGRNFQDPYIHSNTQLAPIPADTDTTDTFAQTFSRIHAREKVTANVSVVSGEDVPPSVFATINTYTWRGGLEKKGARCCVRGCDRKPEWVNEHGEWPLCSVHYNELSLQAKREVRP